MYFFAVWVIPELAKTQMNQTFPASRHVYQLPCHCVHVADSGTYSTSVLLEVVLFYEKEAFDQERNMVAV